MLNVNVDQDDSDIMNKFIENLNKSYDISLDFKKNVLEHVETNKYNENVVNKLYSYIGE